MEGTNMNRIARIALTLLALLATAIAVVPLTSNADNPEDDNSIDARPIVYDEGLYNRWRDSSWDSSVVLWDTSYSHAGNYSASCAYLQPWGGLYFAYEPG